MTFMKHTCLALLMIGLLIPDQPLAADDFGAPPPPPPDFDYSDFGADDEPIVDKPAAVEAPETEFEPLTEDEEKLLEGQEGESWISGGGADAPPPPSAPVPDSSILEEDKEEFEDPFADIGDPFADEVTPEATATVQPTPQPAMAADEEDPFAELFSDPPPADVDADAGLAEEGDGFGEAIEGAISVTAPVAGAAAAGTSLPPPPPPMDLFGADEEEIIEPPAEEAVAPPISTPAPTPATSDVTDKQLRAQPDPAQLAEKDWFSEPVKVIIDVKDTESALASSILYERARQLEGEKRYYESWKAYVDIARKHPTNKFAQGALNGFYSRRMLARAFGLEKQKRYFEAARTYRDVIQRQRHNAPAWYHLGLVYLRYHKHFEAAHCFQKVIDLYPESNKALAGWLVKYKAKAKIR